MDNEETAKFFGIKPYTHPIYPTGEEAEYPDFLHDPRLWFEKGEFLDEVREVIAKAQLQKPELLAFIEQRIKEAVAQTIKDDADCCAGYLELARQECEQREFELRKSLERKMSEMAFDAKWLEQKKQKVRREVAVELAGKFDCRMKPETVLAKLMDWIAETLEGEIDAR